MRRSPGSLLLPALLVLASSLPALGQTAELVEDINTSGDQNGGSSPSRLTAVGGKVFFLAEEPSTGREVWVSDGTAAGTRLLADLCPGPCEGRAVFLGSAGNLLYWIAEDENGQALLWRSDGTRQGTFALHGPSGDLRIPSPSSFQPAEFAVIGRVAFFQGCTSASDCEPWRTDGTPAGTRLVSDVFAGSNGSNPRSLKVIGSTLYFVANVGFGNPSLWKSDGTAARTVSVTDLPSFPGLLTVAANKLFLIARQGEVEGHELWVSDGTAAGTRPLTDFGPTFPFEQTGWLKAFGGRVAFVADDVVHGAELWTSDGTPAGTRRATEFGFHDPFQGGLAFRNLEEVGGRFVFAATDGLSGTKLWTTTGLPGTTAPLADDLAVGDGGLFRVGGRLLFLASDPDHGNELRVTDGTPAGTRLLLDACPGPCDSRFSGPQLLPGAAYFYAVDAARRLQVWRTDGTAAGTKRLTNFAAGGLSDFDFDLAVAGRNVFFRAGSSSGDRELWVTDGAPQGTRLVTDIARGAPSSSPMAMVPFADGVVFTACDGESRELWRTAGSGAQRLTSPLLFSNCDSSDPLDLTVAGGRTFFLREDQSFDPQLWASDGTPGGTVLLTAFAYPSSIEGGLTAFRDGVAFTVRDNQTTTERWEVWTSDGTPQGTGKAFDLPAGNRDLRSLTGIGDDLYFIAREEVSFNTQVWASDATPAGTRQLTSSTAFGSDDSEFIKVGASVYFRFSDQFGLTLWKTDGTVAGTVPLAGPTPFDLTAFGGALYFFGRVFSGEEGLWRSDGTAAGTVPLFDFGFGSSLGELTDGAGRLYFVADDGPHGRELWTSDGTAAGTRLVSDLSPGRPGSVPRELTAAGGLVYFTAHDGVHGAELWRSDGTAAGTKLVQDLAPEALSSDPRELAVSGDRLFFSADDGVSGRELWSLPLGGASGCQATDRALCLAGGRFKVEIAWDDGHGGQGFGHAVPLTADTGTFWFFDQANVEVIVKVLDGRGTNGHFWVYYGALSNLEYSLTVTDTQTGLARRYFNPGGNFASVGDVHGFGRLGAFGTRPLLVSTPPASLPGRVTVRIDPAAATGACMPGPQRLCLNGGRFAAEATFKNAQGQRRPAKAVPLSGDTGYFWFFQATNVEAVLKVLDGRPSNGHFWVYHGALSDREYRLQVTDTQTGRVWTYDNPGGTFASGGDTRAF